MISRERLQELIEKEETVWCASELWGSNKLKMHNKDVMDSDCFHISKTLLLSDSIEFYDEEETYRVPFQLLFETQQEYLNHKEEAEWYKEFGCIERTERLELPTWEKFINKKIKQVCFIGGDTTCFFELYEDKQNNRLILLDHDCDYEYFNEEMNKENYILACRKAKEMFLGETRKAQYERHPILFKNSITVL